ncbi:MAG: hypothetical protein JXR68_03440 [Bacteroidales bacterium]|nr:hypothetical protein [Bacteroidales bacterium]
MSKKKKEKLVRKNKLTINLNDKEYKVLQKFITKYKVKNTSNLVRQALFTYILQQFDKDYPTIFPETEQPKQTENPNFPNIFDE